MVEANGGSAGGQFTFFPQKVSDASGQAQAEKRKLSQPLTLPRHLHRFVLRLLRPAEAAARRLIIVAARGMVVQLSPPRIRKPNAKPLLNRRNGYGTGVVIRPGPLPEWARVLAPKRSSTLSLPLFDPLKRFGGRRRYVKPSAMPRIRSFDDPRIGFFQQPRAPDPLPPSPDDPLDAGRLYRRLEAIDRALNDLPRQAKRMARWQARAGASLAREGVREREIRDDLLHPTPALRADLPGRATGLARPPDPHRGEGKYGAAGGQPKGRLQRLSPMRPGRPPGWSRGPTHQVYEVLNELHGLAVWARECPDTS
jgi:hypothetical protein